MVYGGSAPHDLYRGISDDETGGTAFIQQEIGRNIYHRGELPAPKPREIFDLLTNDGAFENPSVIMNTWDLYWMDIRGESSTSDIGGGMIGSILFAVSYFLFDSQGARIMSATFIIIGIILVTGKSLGDVLGGSEKDLDFPFFTMVSI